MLDVSRSMAEPAKFDMARRIAAALCYIGLAHLDRLTILPFGSELGARIVAGPRQGTHLPRVRALEQLEAAGPTDLRASCKEFASRPRQLGLSVIISDFLERVRDGAILSTTDRGGSKILRTLGHDVFAVQSTSEHDRDPGAFGDVRFVDVETGELRDIEVTPRLAAAYVKRLGRARRGLRAFCGRYGIGYVSADAERPFEEIILQGVPPGTVPRMTFGAMAAGRRGCCCSPPARWPRRCSCSRCGRRACSCRRCSFWQRVLDESRELTLWERIRRAVSLARDRRDRDRPGARGRAAVAPGGAARPAAAAC